MKQILKLKDLPFLQRHSFLLFKMPFISRNTNKHLKSLHRQHSLEESQSTFRHTVFDFTKSDSLLQWASIEDRQFGGSSEADLYFDTQINRLILKGSISSEDKQKLLSYPFIGIIQRYNFALHTYSFNALAITLKSDGLPLEVEFGLDSYKYGRIEATGKIISKSTEQLTYELPFYNFQIRGEEETLSSNKKPTVIMKNIMDQKFNQKSIQISEIALRLQSSQNVKRQIQLNKIELVRTKRGQLSSFIEYRKPYFYIADANQKEEGEREVVDTGDIVFTKKKK